jgi:hypothetical protein
MPIDINLLRADKGGDPDYWREVMRKRFKPVELVDRVIDLDTVRAAVCGPLFSTRGTLARGPSSPQLLLPSHTRFLLP